MAVASTDLNGDKTRRWWPRLRRAVSVYRQRRWHLRRRDQGDRAQQPAGDLRRRPYRRRQDRWSWPAMTRDGRRPYRTGRRNLAAAIKSTGRSAAAPHRWWRPIRTATRSSDLLVANSGGGGTPSVPFGIRRRHLRCQEPGMSGRRRLRVTVAELNGDGKPDALVANADSNNVSVLWAKATAPSM